MSSVVSEAEIGLSPASAPIVILEHTLQKFEWANRVVICFNDGSERESVVELYQLKTFIKVADEGNLTRAAELLFTSQPAISSQIKALEDELGVTLFDRSSRGMSLSAEGQLLYQQAQQTLLAAQQLRSQAEALRGEIIGEPKIGVHTDFEFVQIGALSTHLQQHYPRLNPHFIAGMSAQIVPDVRRHKLDGGFVFGPVADRDLHVLNLIEVPMRLVVPQRWQASHALASLDDLLQLPWIYTTRECPFYLLMTQLLSGRPEPNKVAFVDSEDAVRSLLRAGSGVALMRADDAARLVEQEQAWVWDGAVPSISLNFILHQQRLAEPALAAIIRALEGLWGCSAQSAHEVNDSGDLLEQSA